MLNICMFNYLCQEVMFLSTSLLLSRITQKLLDELKQKRCES